MALAACHLCPKPFLTNVETVTVYDSRGNAPSRARCRIQVRSSHHKKRGNLIYDLYSGEPQRDFSNT